MELNPGTDTLYNTARHRLNISFMIDPTQLNELYRHAPVAYCFCLLKIPSRFGAD